MKSTATALTLFLTLTLMEESVVAPFPPCSPLRFINHAVESEEAAWLFRDLPGHPVPPCAYDDGETGNSGNSVFERPGWTRAPPEQKSVLAFFAQEGTLERESRLGADFWVQQGIPRLNRQFWSVYDSAAGTDFDLKKLKKNVNKDAKNALKEAYQTDAENRRHKRDLGGLLTGIFGGGGSPPPLNPTGYGFHDPTRQADYLSPDFRVEDTFGRGLNPQDGLFDHYDAQPDRAPLNLFNDFASSPLLSTLVPTAEFAPQPTYNGEGFGGFNQDLYLGPESMASPLF